MTTTPTRTCSYCGQTKPLTEFRPNPRGRDGHDAHCLVCDNRRKPTVARLVRNRARNRAYALLVERHPDEFATLLAEQTRLALEEHTQLAAAAEQRGHPDAQVARLKPGTPPRRLAATTPDAARWERDATPGPEGRLDVARCPNCHTHHDAAHVCPTCGDQTSRPDGRPLPQPIIAGHVVPPSLIREWAYLNAIECPPRGPIPKQLLHRYLQANPARRTSS